MTVYANKPAFNVREKLKELEKPSGIAGRAMLAADTPQEQFDLIGAGRRNLVINGDMAVWQRGTSFAGAVPSTFSADRWNVSYQDATNTRTASRSTIVPDGFTYSMEIVGSISQYPSTGVELPVTGKGGIFAKGRNFTYSLYSDAPSAPELFVLFRDNVHGTSGSQVAILINKEMSVIESDCGNGFKRYAITFPITGIPVAGNQCLTIAPRFVNTIIDETYRVTGCQLEAGKVATPFEHRSYGEELALCKRYAQVFTGKSNKRLALSGNGGNTSFPTIVLPVEMRVDPGITYSALSDFNVEGLNGGKNVPTGLSLNVASTTAVTLNCTTTGITGSGTNLLFSNSTGWMLLNAEL